MQQELLPCPRCGSKRGYLGTGTFTQFYNCAGEPDGYAFDGTTSNAVKCIDCGYRTTVERLNRRTQHSPTTGQEEEF